MAFEFKLPDIGEGVVEGEIVRWLVKKGSPVEEDQPMVEIMTDKATVEIPSPVQGTIRELRGAEGETVEVGATLVIIETDNRATGTKPEASQPAIAPQRAQPKAAPKSVPARPSRSTVLATPAVRKMAREMGIDLTTVEGSGPGGRVTQEDLQRSTSEAETPPVVRPAARPEISAEVETIPYRALRKKIGERMALSKHTAAHFTYVEEVDVSELVRLRKEFLQGSGGSEVRLTYLPFIVKAVVAGLKKFPLVNSTLDEEAELIRLKRYYNIGIATATEDGLVVPVVKNCDSKGILRLAAEIFELAEAARRGRSKLEDLRDGTFTITSLGLLGGVLATPILNYPEVAILGVHKIAPKPVVREGEIVVRDIMNLSLSLDHRVVDGAVGAEFLQFVIPLLENPARLLLQDE